MDLMTGTGMDPDGLGQGSGRRVSAKGPVLLMVVLAVVVIGGLEFSGRHGLLTKQRRQLVEREKNARTVVQMFWDAVRNEQWQMAARLLTPETSASMRNFAEENTGVAEVLDALEVFHDRLYPQMMALKRVGGCTLREEDAENGAKKMAGVCHFQFHDESVRQQRMMLGKRPPGGGVENLRVPVNVVLSIAGGAGGMMIESIHFGSPIGVHAFGPSGVVVPDAERVPRP